MAEKIREIQGADDIRRRYENNFSRHLLGVARYSQTRMMNTLKQDRSHPKLRLGFAPYITLVGRDGKRLSDLAQTLGISRQACNQAANQVEAAGYISRSPDPSDGRAKKLVLTPSGIRLRKDGIEIINRLDEEFTKIASEEAIVEAGKTAGRIHRGLELGHVADIPGSPPNITLAGLLPRLSDYTLQRLMVLTQTKGHPRLKLSFGQVLTLIGASGGKIQHIAKLQDVSKQAIGAIATELEALDYLCREPDPRDARQLVLRFTDRGLELIADSVASVDELEQEFSALVGKAAIDRLKSTFRTLYHGLHLEQELFGGSNPVDLSLLAQQLRHQLGLQASRDLGQMLLSSAEGEGH